MQPYFSIITPMFNRAKYVSRAIDSCLNQEFSDFEIIVVDDGSTDNSIEVVRGYEDPRVKLFIHERNRGIGPARNTAIEHACGGWLVILDSDDEMLPGSLEYIYNLTNKLDNCIQRIVFVLKLDNGRESPYPKLEEETWDYDKYIKWSNNHPTSTDYFNVIRKETFKKVRFPENRGHEAIYHLDFAKQFLTNSVSTAVAIQHDDAHNRSLNFTSEKLLKEAISFSAQHDEIFCKHGNDIKKISPPLYLRYLQGAITYNMLAGKRWNAIKYALRHMGQSMISIKTLGVLILGLLGPETLALMKIRAAKSQRT